MSTKRKPDVLVGEPLSAQEQAAYAAWAESIEDSEFEPAPDGAAFEGDAAVCAGRDLLDSIVGAVELDEAISRGRPGLNGQTGVGSSPKRQVRLPRELDALLVQRAEAEKRKLSEVMRDAIDNYLHAS